MRQIIGLILLILGVITIKPHLPADFSGSESAKMGYITGQLTVNAILIGAGIYLLVKKKKK